MFPSPFIVEPIKSVNSEKKNVRGSQFKGFKEKQA